MVKLLGDSLAALSSVRPLYAITAVALYALGVLVSGIRWKTVVAALGHRMSLKQATLAILAAIFVNNVTPASRAGGEVCRVFLVRRWRKISLPIALQSVVIDRLSEIIPVACLVWLALPTLQALARPHRTLLLALLGLALLATLMVLRYSRFGRLRARLAAIKESLASVRIDRHKAAAIVGWAMALWLLDIARLRVVAGAFAVPLDLHQAAALSVVVLFGGLLPTIGGLGTTEGGLAAALYLFGVDLDKAIAITVLERTISYVLSTAAGGLVVLALGGKKLWIASRSLSSATGISPE